jgi:hypothetical protein
MRPVLNGRSMPVTRGFVPFAVMLQAPTFTHTEAGQEGGVAPHFGTNNNFALQQVSLFTGGRFTDNLGAFIQGTYDGVTRRFGWDNTDIRYANSVNIEGHNLLWGVTANNNPTVQDVWNTIPAWHFPFSLSASGSCAAHSNWLSSSRAVVRIASSRTRPPNPAS